MPAKQKWETPTISAEQAKQRRQDAKARKACVDAVWQRAGMTIAGWARCEGCGRTVIRGYVSTLHRGDVHEKRARSLGGDPTNPDDCELLCAAQCHFNGPSGAHRRSVRAV